MSFPLICAKLGAVISVRINSRGVLAIEVIRVLFCFG
jgi:hypothetical protein